MFIDTSQLPQKLEKKVKHINDEIIHANQKLRDTYFSYNDFKTKGQLRLEKRMVSGKQQYDFDINAQEYFYELKNDILLERPDVQEQFNNSILQSLQQDIKPHKTSTYADQVTKEIKHWFKSTQSPSQTKQMLIRFFKRDLLNLKMKKIKTLQRYTWFNNEDGVQKRDEMFRSRLNLMDFEIISLIRRIERLKCDEGLNQAHQSVGQRPRQDQQNKVDFQTRTIEDEELCFSNISREDIQVYLRRSMFINTTSRKLMKLIRQIRWVHCEFRFEIMKAANQRMYQMKRTNIEQNFVKFKFMLDAMERISSEKYPQTPEIKFIVQELLEQTKFNLGEDREFNSLEQRFDSLPFLPMSHFDANIYFQSSCDYFLTKQSLQNITTQSLLIRLNNFVGLMFQYQKKQTEYVIMAKENVQSTADTLQQYINSTSNRVSDLTHLEEDQIRGYLKKPLEKISLVIQVAEDWLKLLIFKPDQNRYQKLTQNLLNDVINDTQTGLLQKVVSFKDEEAMRKYVQQSSQEIVNNSHDLLFLIVENRQYVEKSNLSITLEQLNELFDETKKTKRVFRSKEKIKGQNLQALEVLFDHVRPQQSVVEQTFLVDVLICREQRIQVGNILNACRCIQRRLTYDLLMLFDCKLNRDMDMELILSVAEQKAQQTKVEGLPVNPDASVGKQSIKRRANMIDFVEASRKMDECFIKELKSDASLGRWDKIVVLGEEVSVLSNRGEGLSERPIWYDVVDQDLFGVDERLVKTASFYINKYEKLNRVDHRMGVIVNRYVLMKQLWMKEQQYQSAQLALLLQYITLYDNITDPVELYKLSKLIMNQMASIPVLDCQSIYFEDVYDLNISVLVIKRQIVCDLITLQGGQEKQENKRLYDKMNLFGQVPSEHMEEECGVPPVRSDRTKKSETANHKEGKLYEDDIVEAYMLEKNMDEVFAELSESKQSVEEDGMTHAQQTKRSSHVHKMGKYLLHPESQLRLRFEGSPHYLYGDVGEREPNHSFAHLLDFSTSVQSVRMVLQKCEESFIVLVEALPQKSTTMIMAMLCSLLQQVHDNILNYQEIHVGKIEDFIHDDTSLLQNLQIFSEDVISELQQYTRESEMDSVRTKAKDGLQCSKVKPSHIHYDQNTLEAYLANKKPTHLSAYRGLYLMCNLVELLKLREEFIMSAVETKTLKRIHKKQRLQLGIKTPKQSNEGKTNFKHSFNLDPEGALDETPHRNSVCRSAFLHKYIFCNTTSQLDPSYSEELNFTTQKDVLRFVMPDCLEEFRTLLIYEIAHVSGLAQQCHIWNYRCDEISHIAMELDMLCSNRIFCEQSYIDVERVFHSHENFKKMRKTMDQLNSQGFFDTINEKRTCRVHLSEKKFQEAHQSLIASNKGSNNAINTIVCQKRLRNFKFMLFRLMILDMTKDTCHDAHKVHLVEISRSLLKLSRIMPIYGAHFSGVEQHLPDEIDKKLYHDQKKNVIRSTTQSKKQQHNICGPQMNIIRPFYVMGVEDIFKLTRDNNKQDGHHTSHVSRLDAASVSYMTSFYLMGRQEHHDVSITPSTITNMIELNHHLKYIHKVWHNLQGAKQDNFIDVVGVSNKQFPFVRILKYYISLQRFLEMQLYKIFTHLEQNEQQVLLDMYTLHQTWNQPLNQPLRAPPTDILLGHGRLVAVEDGANKALMSYEEKISDVKDDTLKHLNKKQIIIHAAIDNIVQRIKNNITIQESFTELSHTLHSLALHITDNFVLVDELTTHFKRKASATYKALYWSLSETLGQSFERNSQTKMADKLFHLHEHLYSNYRANNLSVRHFHVKFFNVGSRRFEPSDKHPAYRTNDVSRMFAKQKVSDDPVHRILQHNPIELKRYLHHQDKKKYTLLAEQSEDFKLSQMANWFTKVKVIVRSNRPDRGFLIDDESLYTISVYCQTLHNKESIGQLTQFERRMTQSNFKRLDGDALCYAQFKLGRVPLNPLETADYEDAYINQVLQLTLVRQALLLFNHNVHFPLYSFEYLRYLSDIKSKIQFKCANLKALASTPQDLIASLLNKQQHKFLDYTPDYKGDRYEDKFMLSLIEMLVEKELCYKELTLRLTQRGEMSMQEDMEMLNTFRMVNDNLAGRQKANLTKQKISDKLVLGSNTILPRVKHNPCFSSHLQRDSKTDRSLPAQAKISFLQAFINRLRNKVSRVDLLSSGSGFVVTVNDLEDCVNFLHRSLYQFSEKELKARLETCQMIYDHQQSTIVGQGREIAQLKLQLAQLLNLIGKHSESIIIQKGDQLLYDFDAVTRKLKDFSLCTLGLEEDLREQLRKEFLKENIQLNSEKGLLRQKLEDFKKELLVLCKNEIRQHQSDLIKYVKLKSQEILTQQSAVEESHIKDTTNRMLDEFNAQFERRKQQTFPELSYLQEKDQLRWKKCAPDEDVLFDPYVTTKWINKMRALNIIKLGRLMQKHSDEVMVYELKIHSLQEVSQKVRDYQQREQILKREFVSLHETLNTQKKSNEQLIQDLEGLSLENKRLLKINEDTQQSLRAQRHSTEKQRTTSLDTKADTPRMFPKLRTHTTNEKQYTKISKLTTLDVTERDIKIRK